MDYDVKFWKCAYIIIFGFIVCIKKNIFVQYTIYDEQILTLWENIDNIINSVLLDKITKK